MRQKRWFEWIGVLLALPLLLASCVTPAVQPATVPLMSDDELAEAIGELRVSTADVPGSLDPARAHPRDRTAAMVLNALYQTLVTSRADPMADGDPKHAGKVAPSLAKDWWVNEDWTVVTFHLREDATFANGEPVTAEDVAFSIERLKGIGGAPAYLADTIDLVEAIDVQTVQLTLKPPDLAILDKLAATAFSILDADMVIANGGSRDPNDAAEKWLNANSAGSGAYVLAEAENIPAQLVLVRNDLTEDALDRMPRIVIQTGRGPQAQIDLLLNDATDVALDLDQETASQIDADLDVSLVLTPTLDLFFLQSNQTQWLEGYGDFEMVQQAIRLALDYEGIRALLGGETAATPPSFVPLGFEETLNDREVYQDVNRARDLLAASGYANVPIPLAYPDSEPFRQLAEKISADLHDIGLQTATQGVNTAEVTLSKFPISLSLITPDYLNANTYLDFLPGGAIANRIGWQNDEQDLAAIREEILTTPFSEKRHELFEEAQRRMDSQEAKRSISPFVFVGQPTNYIGVQGTVDYNSHPVYRTNLLWVFRCPCNKCDAVRQMCQANCGNRCCDRCSSCTNVRNC